MSATQAETHDLDNVGAKVRDDDDDDNESPPAAADADAGPSKKRQCDASDGNDLQQMMTLFTTEVTKVVVAKRKRTKALTDEVTLSNQHRVTELWHRQREEMASVHAAMTAHMSSFVDEWEKDVARMNVGQEKVARIVTRSLKNTQTGLDATTERIKDFGAAYKALMERQEQQQLANKEAFEKMKRSLKVEMGSLQRQMLADIHKVDIDSVRNTFKTATFL